MTRNATISLCLPLLLASMPQARSWWVAPSSASSIRTGTVAYPLVGVQVGLDSARSGDTVILAEGTYEGGGYVNRGKIGIVLGSRMLVDGDAGHAARTVLDGLNTDTTGFGVRSPILQLTLSDTAAFRIVGLTFRRGGSSRGGAVRILRASAGGRAGLEIRSSSFLDNVAIEGGAVFGGTNRFRGCLFSGNLAVEDTAYSKTMLARGGAFSRDTALVAATGSTWDSCTFLDNRASGAGAIRESKASLVRWCRFERNRSTKSSAGAIWNESTDTTRIEGTVFRGNRSSSACGVLCVDLFHVRNCTFEDNEAVQGGVFFSILARRSWIEGSVFRGNKAAQFGGVGMGQSVVVVQSVFEGNAAQYGAVFHSITYDARRSTFLRNAASRSGGVSYAGLGTLTECLVAGNEAGQGGIAHTTGLTSVNSTLKGRVNSSAPDVFQAFVTAKGSILDLFQEGGGFALQHTLYRGTRAQATLDVANSHDYLLDVDPGFLNPLAGDYRLLPASPGVDRNDSVLDASGEPPCAGRAARRDLGFYGNTPDATCPDELLGMVAFEPSAITRTLRVGEVFIDSTRLRWTGSGSLDPDSTLSVIGSVSVPPPGPLVDGVRIRLLDTARAAGTRSSAIRVRVRAQGADVGCVVTTTVLAQPIDSIFGDAWYSRGALLGSTVRDTFQLVNRGSNPVRIDSAAPTSPRFQLLGSLAGVVVPPGGARQVVIAFTSNTVAPVRARLRLWSRNFAWPDTGIVLAGSAYDGSLAPLPPVAVIDTVAPREVAWNGVFSAVGIGWDGDGLGSGAPIAQWQWVIGSDTLRTPGVTAYPASKLALGWNRLTLRVRDDEAAWSPRATDSVFVRGLPPVFDSVSASKGVLLRRDGDLVLAATAHDADENAVAGTPGDGIARIVWHSDLEGILDTGARVSIPAAKLRIGTHAIWAVAVDGEGDSSLSDTVHLPVQTSIGVAVVVAGTSFGDIAYHRTNLSPNANWIYQTLRSRGYSDEQIWYANRIGWQSLGDPFVDAKIVDETGITRELLRERLLSFKPAVEAGTPLLVALVGHGDASEQDGGRFFLNDSESITPWDLNNWLGEYDRIDSSGRIVLVLDFCASGAFQTALRTGFDRHRVVVTSADAGHPAYFVRGKGFSQVLFAGVRKGRSLARCFQDAKSWSDLAGAPGNLAGPLLNADMDGSWNTAADLAAAGSVWIGGSQQNQDPEPGIDTGWISPSAAGVVVSAKLTGTASRAWIEYRQASDDPAAAPRVVSMRAGANGIWSAGWDGGSSASDLAVHAANASGALAFPWVIDASALLEGGAGGARRSARYDRGLGRIVLGRRVGAGEMLEIEVLDVSGRRLGGAVARADATGWAEASWRPEHPGFHILRARWNSGSETARVLVTEIR